jgi:hypothetical protein
MAHAHWCWLPKTTNTHSKYVTLIASSRKQRFRERASVLRCAYIACLVDYEPEVKRSKGLADKMGKFWIPCQRNRPKIRFPIIFYCNLSSCCECCIISSGWFPGVLILPGDITEHSVSSIFIGRANKMKFCASHATCVWLNLVGSDSKVD